MRRFSIFYLLLTCFLLLFPLNSLAEKAADMTSFCSFTARDSSQLKRLTDGKYRTPYKSEQRRENWIEVNTPGNHPAGGIYISWTTGSSPVLLETWDEASDSFQTLQTVNENGYLHEFIPLDAVNRFRLRSTDKDGTISIVEMKVYEVGEMPDDVQQWQPKCTDADLLVLVAHPDDEYIFMGGMIPLYAGERGLHVAVAYMTNGNNDDRVHELLNGLWTAGCREYPWLINARDFYTNNTRAGYQVWGGRSVTLDMVADLIEAVSPSVVVVHDIEGEYGHGAHRALADAALSIIRDMQRVLKAPVKKLYLHLWEENPIVMDWHQPLKAFNGDTAMEVAVKAFACHISQQNQSATMPNGFEFYFTVKTGGPYDNAKFGLAWSDVGPDETNDLMDHITERTLN